MLRKKGQPLFVSETEFTLPSFAKINWTLSILGQRADGYHELLTIFQTVTLHDRLSFAPSEDDEIHLSCDNPDIPVNETNLINRAALALRERHGIKNGVRIHLEKLIPAGGGLGGGSSNAAVAFLGLMHLWKIETKRDELVEIGARLGADVPFFFTGGAALGTGLGTTIEPLPDVSEKHILILTPGVSISTATAYKSLNAPALTKDGSDIMLAISRARGDFPDSLQRVMRNDFERVIFRSEPEIARAKQALLDSGASGALLAGSGSSVFGIFDKQETLAQAARDLKREQDWRVFSCLTLSRDDYFEALGECTAPLKS